MTVDGIKIDSREIEKVDGLFTGKKYQIKVKTKFTYSIVEMEDVHFHFDSAVLYPITRVKFKVKNI